MTATLQIIIVILMQLDALWAKIPATSYTLDKAELSNWATKVSEPVASVIGEEPHQVWSYFETFPSGVLGGTMTDPTILPKNLKRWGLGMSLGKPSLGCTRTMALNAALKYEHNPFYDTPMFISTIAHEVTHTYQGMLCNGDDDKVEAAAELASWAALGKMARDDPVAYSALIYTLRHRFIEAALDLSYQSGEKPSFIDELKLTNVERDYYLSLKPEYLKLYARYWTDPVTEIIEDSDGVLSGARVPSGSIDASYVKEHINK